MRQKPWSEQEAIVLLEAFIQVRKGKIDKKIAISKVSKILRMIAVYNGEIIDDVFRNEAGITFQMQSMESAFYGRTVSKPATKLFTETVVMKRKNKEKYEELLKEIRQMMANCNRDQYQIWLKESGMSEIGANNYGKWLNYLSEYAIECGVCESNIYEYEDVNELSQIYSKIYENREYSLSHKGYLTALRRYISYCGGEVLQLGREVEVDNNDTDSKRTDYQNWLISKGMTYNAARNYGKRLMNLSDIALSKGYIEKSFYDYDYVDDLMKAYEKINNDDEILAGNRDYMTSLKRFISYRSDDNIVLARKHSIVSDNQLDSKRLEYQNWLVESGMKETAARNYGGWLINLSLYINEKGIASYSLLEQDDVSTLLNLYEELNNDEYLVLEHRDYLTSLKKYISYRSDGTILLGRRSKTTRFSNNIADEIEIGVVAISEEELKRFSEVLESFFEEGLVLNALKLDKFRMIYKDVFEEEATSDDNLLISQLKIAGNYIEGRVYPKHSANQSALLDQIREEICKTLNEGASCVYISAVMSRWNQELTSGLNIYNETALRELIMSEGMQGVYASSNVFKMTFKEVSTDTDIIEYMKSCHGPVNYAELQDKLWYIPLDVIKRTLVTVPSLVNVDAETYMYAPNFPASSRELMDLVQLMSAKIRNNGFLVSKDIAEIITEKCPTIAINTEGYKDWAYRNILRYILRDYFEFGNSVVSEKGVKLEMKQVYRGFCKEHEHLSLDELKQFSSEVGVQIYWDDVLSEMIRINDSELVRKDLVHFNIDLIDNVLDDICQGDYIPINKVSLFLHFPVTEYPWNSYLLESYLKYSKKFALYHVSYSENGVFGVVVRQKSTFTDYSEVVIDTLARSNNWNNVNDALNYIVELGYQAKRRWTGFEKIVKEAAILKEKMQSERK